VSLSKSSSTVYPNGVGPRKGSRCVVWGGRKKETGWEEGEGKATWRAREDRTERGKLEGGVGQKAIWSLYIYTRRIYEGGPAREGIRLVRPASPLQQREPSCREERGVELYMLGGRTENRGGGDNRTHQISSAEVGKRRQHGRTMKG